MFALPKRKPNRDAGACQLNGPPHALFADFRAEHRAHTHPSKGNVLCQQKTF